MTKDYTSLLLFKEARETRDHLQMRKDCTISFSAGVLMEIGDYLQMRKDCAHEDA